MMFLIHQKPQWYCPIVFFYDKPRVTCKRLDGSMYSCTSFGMKVGGGLGSAIAGWLLAASKFDATAAVQPASCSNMLTFMFAGVPVIITIIVLLIYFFLDVEKKNAEIREATKA